MTFLAWVLFSVAKLRLRVNLGASLAEFAGSPLAVLRHPTAFARRKFPHVFRYLHAAGHFEHNNVDVKTWRDAFLNAAMLLGGMGPIHTPATEGGKVFAGLYALYAGLVFLVAAALLLTPIFHRLLHRFHWDRSAQNSRRHRAAPSDESHTA
jgi:hypothetical protein